MTREITRYNSIQDEDEAKIFGGPFWSNWKHSLLNHLGIDEFPDQETEEILHKWWYLRMSLRRVLISDEEFDKKSKDLFPEESELVRILDEDSEGVLARGLRYITDRLGSNSDISTSRNSK
jgi:hypothetical protein